MISRIVRTVRSLHAMKVDNDVNTIPYIIYINIVITLSKILLFFKLPNLRQKYIPVLEEFFVSYSLDH